MANSDPIHRFYTNLRRWILSEVRRVPARMRRLRTSPSHRRYAARRAFALAAAVAVMVHVEGRMTAAEDSRRQWSAEVQVLTATSSIRPGGVIDNSNTVVEPRPGGHIPPSALRSLPDSPLVASGAIERGEVVVSGRTTGNDADVAPGRRAITVDATTAMPTLAAGQHVDVLGSTGVSGPSTGVSGPSTDVPATPGVTAGGEFPPVSQVATDAIVLQVGAGDDPGTQAATTATLSVRSSDVLALGMATMNGAVVLVVRSG